MLLGRLRLVPKAILIAGAALGTAACSAGAPADGDVGSFGAAIEGGEPDTEHSNVFALFAQQRRGISACTATLIAPNVLLTARHCVSNTNHDEVVVCGQAEFGSVFDPEQLFASNPVQLEDARSPWFRGSEVRIPEEGDDTCGFDIALVRLSENVPANVAVPAIPRIDRHVTDGELYTAVGYGVDLEGVQTGRQVLKDLRIDCEPGSCSRRIVPVSEFVGEAGICNGDSGGPAFDTEGKVVGVVSRGADDCSFPIYGSVAAWRDLIVGFTARAAVIGGYEAPFWVKSGSSDSGVELPQPEPEPVPVEEPGEVTAPGMGKAETRADEGLPKSSCAYHAGDGGNGSPLPFLGALAVSAVFGRRRRGR